MKSLSFLLCLTINPVSCWYLPGVAPHDFTRGEKVDLKVNKLTSTKTQIPYEYYSLPFCTPPKGITMAAENLGEFLSGDRIDNSGYQIFMRDDSTCNILCQKVYGKNDVIAFKNAIDEDYHHNWIIDNLPAASIVSANGVVETSYSKGFPVGYKVPSGPSLNSGHGDGGGIMAAIEASAEHYLFNHVELIIKYHELGPDANRVVGFFVEPRSVRHLFANGEHWNPDSGDDYMPYLTTCEKYAADPIDAAAMDNAEWDQLYGSGSKRSSSYNVEPQKVEPGTVLFTYDVTWRPSNIHWASRWDIYLSMGDAVPAKVHWFSIINSLLIVVFLSALVLMILIRAVYGDISRYNLRNDDVKPLSEEQKAIDREESGWKLVHGNVFSPPAQSPLLFCVAVGTGQQLLSSAVAIGIFSALGFLSPANRGSLLLAAICLFCLFSFGGAHRAGRLHRKFRGSSWVQCGVFMATGFPGLCFVVFVVANLMLHAIGSSGAVPIGTMVAVVFFWFGVSAPLALGGSYLGFVADPPIEFALPSDTMPRPIPEQPWFLGLAPTIVLGGILPFGACFVELFFVLSSMWMDQYYYVFGFLLLVFCILLITCAEVTVVLVYFQLCAEDYNWWWRSFVASGSTAIYVFLYSAIYFSKLEANLAVTYVIYFGYMFVGCFGLFLLCGSVGFGAALWFISQIYSSIKVD
jgi:transmembrane 9 superfamily protein 2/4